MDTTPSFEGKRIPKDSLRAMLIRENELRLSPEIQAIYKDRNENPMKGDWISYTYKLQEDLVKEFGYGESPEEIKWALFQLRTATQVHPDLSEIPLYVKYNRAKRGNLKVGDSPPPIPTFRMCLRAKWCPCISCSLRRKASS